MREKCVKLVGKKKIIFSTAQFSIIRRLSNVILDFKATLSSRKYESLRTIVHTNPNRESQSVNRVAVLNFEEQTQMRVHCIILTRSIENLREKKKTRRTVQKGVWQRCVRRSKCQIFQENVTAGERAERARSRCASVEKKIFLRNGRFWCASVTARLSIIEGTMQYI